jgi:hypothetical protein
MAVASPTPTDDHPEVDFPTVVRADDVSMLPTNTKV